MVREEDLQLIDVRVEDTVHESDRGRLVGVLIGELDVDFPVAALERCCSGRRHGALATIPSSRTGMVRSHIDQRSCRMGLTFGRTLERHIELLHVVVDQGDLVVAHHHLHHVGLYPPLWARHCCVWLCMFEGCDRGTPVPSPKVPPSSCVFEVFSLPTGELIEMDTDVLLSVVCVRSWACNAELWLASRCLR